MVSARKYLWSGEGGEGRGDVVLHVAKASPFPFAMYHMHERHMHKGHPGQVVVLAGHSDMEFVHGCAFLSDRHGT